MKIRVIICFVCLSAYFPKATTDAETVWLTDVTTRLQRDKRAVSNPDLPDQLSFHLKRKSHALTLNLKRNYQIDPNADIYIVQNLKDGRTQLEKRLNLEKADVAYYQDRENGAFMTARCVKRSGGQCDILINGNIRIGDGNYDLRPSESDFAPSDFLEIKGLRGKRYVLQEHANIQSGMSVENNDIKVSTQNVARVQNVVPTGEIIYGRTNTKNDKTRNLKNYYVDVLVLTDSGIWELFLSMADTTASLDRRNTTAEYLREYFSHIINGVDMLYKGIHDPTMEITVKIRAFAVLENEQDFPHIQSKVELHQGNKMVDGRKYFRDLKYWDINIGSKVLAAYDEVILFTRHVLYDGTFNQTDLAGLSDQAGVCDTGRRVAMAYVEDYFMTTTTTTHELGHALGAVHDGSGEAKHCSSKDQFIMSTHGTAFTPRKKYTGNPWLFSRCSVESFKKTLVNKTCVATTRVQDQILRQQPGERYTLDEQCHIINGQGSVYCGRKREAVCRFMRCRDPKTKKCNKKYLSAADGTTCGDHKWCQKGLCVPKAQE